MALPYRSGRVARHHRHSAANRLSKVNQSRRKLAPVLKPLPIVRGSPDPAPLPTEGLLAFPLLYLPFSPLPKGGRKSLLKSLHVCATRIKLQTAVRSLKTE